MCLQARVFRARHDRTEKDRFELAAVVGEVTVRLAKCRDNLWHLEPEYPIFVCEGRAMALRISLMALGGPAAEGGAVDRNPNLGRPGEVLGALSDD